MVVYFPQWQGSGDGKRIESGAKVIRDILQKDIDIVDIPLAETSALKHDINHHDAIVAQLNRFKNHLKEHQPKTIRTIGGDCGLEIVPVSYLNSVYENLGVIWFDAHADINSPKESPSKNFHGMPLRTLLGESDNDLLNALMFSTINESQIHYIGLRDVDDSEQLRLSKGNMFAPLTIDVDVLTEMLQHKGITNLYLHFDVDCLSPSAYSDTYYEVKNGLEIFEAENLISTLAHDFNVVGTSILESTAENELKLSPIRNIINQLFIPD